MQITNALGRRKTAVARVFVKDGNGKIVVNKRDYKEYFSTVTLHNAVNQAFAVLNLNEKYDVTVNVNGGGITGQAQAIRLGIARALCEINGENRPALKAAGLLTRDPRMVERKKFGQKKARRRFQFSKR
jgi:small subunit ribosomal protein S9